MTSCIAISLALAVHCGASPADTAEHMRVLTRAIEEQARRAGETVDPAQVRFRADSSRVVPGMVYHWAQYPLRRISHTWAFAVVAVVDGRVERLESASDWSRLVDVRPRWEDETFAAACAEVVAFTSVRRNVYRPPTLYRGPESESERVVAFDEIVRRAAPPRVMRSRGRVVVDAWFMEAGQTTQFRCRFSVGGVTVRARACIDVAGFVPDGNPGACYIPKDRR